MHETVAMTKKGLLPTKVLEMTEELGSSVKGTRGDIIETYGRLAHLEMEKQ
jgi:hypothetical protein